MPCILVLPLPRSGSSMVGGILQHLGVAMGPCEPPDAANPLGYFEDVRFVGLHRAWSRRYETNPKRAALKLPPWDPPLGEVDLSRYARLIRVCKRQPYWGVKDPELCYYAGHFAAILHQPIQLIATTRDLDAAAASLGERRHFSPADCTMIIEEYARRQTQTIHELTAHDNPPAITIDYDTALADPEGTVQQIAGHVRLPTTTTAVAFVSPKLRRHRQEQPVDTLRNTDQGQITATM